ncbi:Ead/Ea22-like family protein [Citrobacter cronae]|uniref:hypothetical protein n=1 Tax=Citrobacter cronae TaxID=1748967 RepID=UPI00351045BC
MITKQLVETIKHNGILASAGELKKLFTKAVEAEEKNIELEKKLTDLAVQLANAESKCRVLAAENENARNAVQVFCDVVGANTDAICEEVGRDGVRAILAAMNATGNMPATDAFLAEMRAQGVEMFAERKNNEMMSLHPDTHAVGSIAAAMSAEVKELREFAAQLRKGGAA